MASVEKWGCFEVATQGKTDGNPFTDYVIEGTFSSAKETKTVRGFYDGEGTYKVRFMPSFEGEYTYTLSGTALLDGASGDAVSGSFTATAPTEGNHGPVRVAHEVYLEYEDGTPYHSIGTTCYAWVHQTEERQQKTLETLKNSSFNKIRFCIFPKFYLYNETEPVTYPFEKLPDGTHKGMCEYRLFHARPMINPKDVGAQIIQNFDATRPNPEHFKRFDERIQELMDMGIEADIILLHPYDKWGFCSLTDEAFREYLEYCVARFGTYRNVWWSMANEYDLFFNFIPEGQKPCFETFAKTWDMLGETVYKADPYRKMLSIHNCMEYYDYSREWITHCSMQRIDLYRCVEDTDTYLKKWNKPVVWDEITYEGDINMGWGNITGEEMVRRFWEATLRGGNGGHGETFLGHDKLLWWSHGVTLWGESDERFKFLKKIWDETPGGHLQMGQGMFDEVVGIPLGEKNSASWFAPPEFASYEIHYYTFMRPGYREFNLPAPYRIEVIDTWNMTIEDRGVHEGFTKVDLPARQWMAIRLRKA